VLVAANQPLAERLGHAMFDGQLYFADSVQLALVWVAGLSGLLVLGVLSKRLLLAHVYPDFFRVRGLKTWPIEGGFDVLAALLLAMATMNLGVMGAFALVFIPPWLAFRRGRNWRAGLWLALLIGVLSYVLAFLVALGLDQPFGPLLALLLISVGLVIA